MNSFPSRTILARIPIVAAAAVLVALPACSDDDDTASTTDTTTEASPSTSTGSETTMPATDAGVEDFCQAVADADAYFQTLEGPPDQETVDDIYGRLTDNAPDDLTDTVAVVIEENDAFLAAGPESEGPSDEFFAAYGETIGWMSDNCGWNTLAVTGEDYAFEGIDDVVPGGPQVLQFTNTGEEIHELLLMRVNDGVTESIDELLALPEEEAESKVTQVGGAFALPGEEGFATADLDAGQYVAICFVPEGMTLDAMAEMEATGAEPEGAPHFTLGMIREFDVE